MKYCSKCGSQINDDAVVCINCGCKVEGFNPTKPVAQLKTNRGLVKFILLSLITFGIYGLVVMSSVSSDINTIATRYDGKKTMHFCLLSFIFSWLTCGIAVFVCYHKISARIGKELTRRGISYNFGADTYWSVRLFTYTSCSLP